MPRPETKVEIADLGLVGAAMLVPELTERRLGHCPVGHALEPRILQLPGHCDVCAVRTKSNEKVMHCPSCRWYLCGQCQKKESSSPGEWEWRVSEQLVKHSRKGTKLESATFKLPPFTGKFRLHFWPKGHRDALEGYCSAFLWSEQTITAQMMIKVNGHSKLIDAKGCVSWEACSHRGYNNFAPIFEGDVQLAVVVLRTEDAPTCRNCRASMEWSTYSEGEYSLGWTCDNADRCGASRVRGQARWFCRRCQNDLCMKCHQNPQVASCSRTTINDALERPANRLNNTRATNSYDSMAAVSSLADSAAATPAEDGVRSAGLKSVRDKTLERPANVQDGPTCLDCSSPMEWSNYAEGPYAQRGWSCDNERTCGIRFSRRSRWFCYACSNDICSRCHRGPQEDEKIDNATDSLWASWFGWPSCGAPCAESLREEEIAFENVKACVSDLEDGQRRSLDAAERRIKELETALAKMKEEKLVRGENSNDDDALGTPETAEPDRDSSEEGLADSPEIQTEPEPESIDLLNLSADLDPPSAPLAQSAKGVTEPRDLLDALAPTVFTMPETEQAQPVPCEVVEQLTTPSVSIPAEPEDLLLDMTTDGTHGPHGVCVLAELETTKPLPCEESPACKESNPCDIVEKHGLTEPEDLISFDGI